MTIIFKEPNDGIYFEHFTKPPVRRSSTKINISALIFYSLYRNSIYDSYKSKSDLDEDVKNHDLIFNKANQHNACTDPIYHYASRASLQTLQDWFNLDSNIHCFIAYQTIDGLSRRIGFVHFQERILSGKNIVYIAQAGAAQRGCHIGRRLMECVLSYYPENTEFYIVTRKFNTEAKTLYQTRLGFDQISEDEVASLRYDDRYCGFKHTTSQREIDVIKEKFTDSQKDVSLLNDSDKFEDNSAKTM